MGVLLNYPLFHADDDNGSPLTGGLLYTYIAGSSTAKATYTTRAMSTANANPVVLNSRGEAIIYGAGLYKLILKTAAGVTIWTQDNVEMGPGQGSNAFFLNPAETDHGIAGTGSSLYDILTALGTTEKATVYLAHNGAAATTTYTVSTTYDASTYSNVSFEIENGAVLAVGSGATLTFPSPSNIKASPNQQIFSVAGTVKFNVSGIVYPDWWGGKPDAEGAGVGTDNSTAINAAISSASAWGITVYLRNGMWGVAKNINLNKYGTSLIGESRIGTLIVPLVTPIPTYNSLIIIGYQPLNGSIAHLRFNGGTVVGGYSGYAIYSVDDGTVHNLFSTRIFDIWCDFGTTAYFFKGGAYYCWFHHCQFESIRTRFWFDGSGANNNIISDIDDYSCLYPFIEADSATPTINLSICNVIATMHAYDWWIKLDTTTSLNISNVKYTMDVGATGQTTAGFISLTNCTEVNISNFSADVADGSKFSGLYLSNVQGNICNGYLKGNCTSVVEGVALQVLGVGNDIKVDNVEMNTWGPYEILINDSTTGKIVISNSAISKAYGYAFVAGGAAATFNLCVQGCKVINGSWGTLVAATPLIWVQTSGRLEFINNEIGRDPVGVAADASNPLSMFILLGTGTGVMTGNRLVGFDASKMYGAGNTQYLLSDFNYESAALADDGTVNLPNATCGVVIVSCNAEAGVWSVQADGTCTKVVGTANTDNADTDAKLDVYDGGTYGIVKNRLGATGRIRIEYKYN